MVKLLMGKVGRNNRPWLPAGMLTHSCASVVRSMATVCPGAALTRTTLRRVLSRSLAPLALRALQAKIGLAWFHAVRKRNRLSQRTTDTWPCLHEQVRQLRVQIQGVHHSPQVLRKPLPQNVNHVQKDLALSPLIQRIPRLQQPSLSHKAP